MKKKKVIIGVVVAAVIVAGIWIFAGKSSKEHLNWTQHMPVEIRLPIR